MLTEGSTVAKMEPGSTKILHATTKLRHKRQNQNARHHGESPFVANHCHLIVSFCFLNLDVTLGSREVEVLCLLPRHPDYALCWNKVIASAGVLVTYLQDSCNDRMQK